MKYIWKDIFNENKDTYYFCELSNNLVIKDWFEYVRFINIAETPLWRITDELYEELIHSYGFNFLCVMDLSGEPDGYGMNEGEKIAYRQKIERENLEKKDKEDATNTDAEPGEN